MVRLRCVLPYGVVGLDQVSCENAPSLFNQADPHDVEVGRLQLKGQIVGTLWFQFREGFSEPMEFSLGPLIAEN